MPSPTTAPHDDSMKRDISEPIFKLALKPPVTQYGGGSHSSYIVMHSTTMIKWWTWSCRAQEHHSKQSKNVLTLHSSIRLVFFCLDCATSLLFALWYMCPCCKAVDGYASIKLNLIESCVMAFFIFIPTRSRSVQSSKQMWYHKCNKLEL